MPHSSPSKQPFLCRRLKSHESQNTPGDRTNSRTLTQDKKMVRPCKPPEKVKPAKSGGPVVECEHATCVNRSHPCPCPHLSLSVTATQTTHIPKWLLDASHALDVLVSDHPKAMSAISAILIALGGVPSVPAVASGEAGTFLASGAAQVIGHVMTDVGVWMKAENGVGQHGRK